MFCFFFLLEILDGSSEDEPLIKLVQKRKVLPAVTTPQRKTRSPKKQRGKHVTGKDSKGAIKAFFYCDESSKESMTHLHNLTG